MTRAAAIRAAAALALLVVVAPALPAAPAECPSESAGRWTSFAGPDGATGPLRGLATGFGTTYVTDGAALYRHDGCSWTTLSLTGAVQAYAVRPDRIVAAVDRTLVTGVRLLVSDDGGDEWREPAAAGLPPVVRAASVALSVGDVAYLLADVGGQRALYRTADAGESWQPVAGSVDLVAARGVAADPRFPDDVWAWDATALWRSTNGGTTFDAVPHVRGPVHDLALRDRGPGVLPEVVVSANGALLRSDDGGAAWRILRAPRTVTVADLGADGAVVAAAGKSVTLFAPGTNVGDDAATPVAFADVVMDGTDVVGVAGSRLYRADVASLVDVPARVARQRVLRARIGRAGVVPPARRAVLHPADTVVELTAGERRRIRYALDLGRRRRAVDVFFLVDTTASLRPRIDELRRQIGEIVTDLRASGIDAEFGVGAFREYPNTIHSAQWQGNYAYRLVQRVAPAGPALVAALDALETDAGSDDGRTSALGALYQMATGAGQRIGPAYSIPPGLDAGFNPGREHVAVLLTDSEPRPAQPGYPGPALDDVATALARRDVKTVGIVAGPPPPGVPGPLDAMRALAARTGARAPANGVDCDADGRDDVLPGAPLVCASGGRGVADAIVGVVRGLGDAADVTLTATARGDVEVGVTPGVFPAVEIGVGGRLAFDVDYACPAVDASTPVPVDLVARHGTTVTRATATVLCVPVPVRDEPLRRAAVALVAGAAAPPPPPPVSNVQPIPNANLNQAASPNAQGGLATEDESELQLAVADQRGEDAVAPLLAAAAMTAAAGAAMMAQWTPRRSPSPAHQPSRRTSST